MWTTLVSVIFDEILAGRHDETPIQGIRETECGIFLDAHSTAGDLRQAGEANLWKNFFAGSNAEFVSHRSNCRLIWLID